MSRSNEKNRNGRWVELEERQLFQISYSYWIGGDGDWELFHDSFMSKSYEKCVKKRDEIFKDEDIDLHHIEFEIAESIKFDDKDI
tara:strand:- start:1446 stop:1700 length:255 start_codon:yes stop_codon:yes gene_type:complete